VSKSRTSNNVHRTADPGLMVVLSGPSGAGKSTLCHAAMNRRSNLEFSISYTTRPPRPGEVHGRDYFFVDDSTFDRMVAEGAFIEWARVYGNRYGTSLEFIRSRTAAGADLILDIDSQGAAQIKKRFPEAVFVFCLAPSQESLENRLRARGTETPESLARRLNEARNEIRQAVWYDYIIVNDDLSTAVDEFVAVIVAERCRVHRTPARTARLLAAYGLDQGGE